MDIRKIFDVTGGTEFMEKIDSCSQQVANEEKVDLEEAYFLKIYMENSGKHQ